MSLAFGHEFSSLGVHKDVCHKIANLLMRWG